MRHRIEGLGSPRIDSSTGLPQIARIDTWKLKKEFTSVDGSYRQAKKSKKGDLWQWMDVRWMLHRQKFQETVKHSHQRQDVKNKLAELKKLVQSELSKHN